MIEKFSNVLIDNLLDAKLKYRDFVCENGHFNLVS